MFKRIVYTVFILFVVGNISTRSEELVTIAVLRLDMEAGVSESYAGALTCILRSFLFNTESFRVLERGKMEEILEEQGFQISGCTSVDCAVQAGQLLGVQQMIAGSISKLGELHTVSLRLIEVESGEIVRAEIAQCICSIEDVATTSLIEAAYKIVGKETPENHTQTVVRKNTENETEGDKKFRLAKIIIDEGGNNSRAISLLNEIVDKYGNCSSADDALYILIINEKSLSAAEKKFLQMRAYYPESHYISEIPKWLESKKQDFVESIEFVSIPAGSFKMGSRFKSKDEKPAHKVNIPPFHMMNTEVTQAQWQTVMELNPSNYKSELHPVESISWYDVQEFVKRMNELFPGKGYRLPSEAEWEYACRAGTTTIFHSGNSVSRLQQVAWFEGNSNGTTHPVGQKEPNAWGLYDMHGNVWEWCEDSYHANYKGAPSDGSVWITVPQNDRVTRGGSWLLEPDFCRSAFRLKSDARERYYDIGFRLVYSSSNP